MADLICLDPDDDDVIADDDDDDVIEFPASKYDKVIAHDDDIFVADDDDDKEDDRDKRKSSSRSSKERSRGGSVSPSGAEAMKRRIEEQLGLSAGRNYSSGRRATRSTATVPVQPVQLEIDDSDDDDIVEEEKEKKKKRCKKTKKRKRRESYSSKSSSAESDSDENNCDYSDVTLMNSKEARKLVAKVNAGLASSKKIPKRPSDLFPNWQLNKYLPEVQPQIQDMSCAENPSPVHPSKRKRIRVLSLFDGISTGLVALKSLGLDVSTYYASEVDECAIKCSKRNHPEVVQVGDVRNITIEDLTRWGPFDFLIGGSPCNDFSRVNPHREGFTGKWGKLFFDYARILNICRAEHEKDMKTTTPFYWLFENVIMDTEDRNTISYSLGCDPVKMDSMYVSPMKRPRLYWSNIPGLGDPIQPNPEQDKLNLQECLEPGRKARVRRVGCITTSWSSQQQGKFLQDPVWFLGEQDRLWMVEIERCFGFPDHYTDVANLHPDKRLVLLGMSWSVPCVRHLMQPLLRYFKSANSVPPKAKLL